MAAPYCDVDCQRVAAKSWSRRAALILCTLGFATGAQLARGEDCKLQQLAEMPLIQNEWGHPIVSVPLDGHPRNLVIDTGGYWSLLDPVVAAGYPQRRIRGFAILGGLFPINTAITVPSIELGGVKINNVEFYAAPPGYMKIADGSLGANFLKVMDVEIDPARKKVIFFSQNHCQGNVVYWNHENVAVIPMTISRNLITIPVELNGQRLRALIDTGTSETILSQQVAREFFHVDASSPGTQVIGAVAGQKRSIFTQFKYQFKSLETEGISFNNPWITVRFMIPQDIDMIIGMHHLAGLHLYFAYGEKLLYATAADDAPPSAGAAKQQEAGSGAQSAISRTNARDWIERASAALSAKDLPGAQSAIAQAMRFDPDYAPAFAARAEVELRQQNQEAALADLNKSASLDPQNAKAFELLTIYYQQKGERQKALENANQWVALEPKSPDALNARCWISGRIGLLDAALIDCNDALYFVPRSPVVLANRAFVHLKAGRFTEAVADYGAAIKLDPKRASAFYGRGQAKRQMGDSAGADADLQSAKAIDPNIANTFGNWP